MSWREILGVTSIPNATTSPQNSHNEQNPENQGNCANTANTARVLSRESAQLEEALADACENPTITLQKIAAAITAADKESWQKDRIGDAALKAFTDSLTERVEINLGTRPIHYTVVVKCFRPPSFEFSSRPVRPRSAAIRRCICAVAAHCNSRLCSP